MTTELNLIAALSHNRAAPLTVAQKEALERAVTKIVAPGRAPRTQSRPEDSAAGVGSDVGELLECVAARSGEAD